VGLVTEPGEDPAIVAADIPPRAIPDGLSAAEVLATELRASELPGRTEPLAATEPLASTERPAAAEPLAGEPLAGEPLAAEPLATEPPPIEIADPGDASLLALIDRLAAMLDRTGLTELEVQVGATGLVLRKPSAFAPVPEPTIVVPGAPPAAGESAATDGARADAGPPARPSVKAPLTGIWYGSPAPGSAPYVSAGGEVAVGQVIGLIEAMKLFNEIKSDMAGRVVKVHAEDGKLVKAKQSLIEVEPL
jgi:acetyl-CoA carboxylase biotin carboxyl carrier protein